MTTAIYAIGFCTLLGLMAVKQGKSKPVVVDGAGHGDFKTIQEAVNSLPDSSDIDRTIVVKKGVYHEKVYITKNHIELIGEDPQNTVITDAIARDIWLCEGKSGDWGTATLNLRGSDLTLKNLSIVNSYGFDHLKDTTINCEVAGKPLQKTVSRTGHQMALRSFQTTRLRVINCTLKAYGGDTVSPWNTVSGLFYFKNCTMEGSVDMYCPRGWAYAEGCKFICHSMEAAIWHDGSGNKEQKTVLKDCSFTGDGGFKLGRYHKEAQFYLVNCRFATNMADAPIYQAASSKGVQWGRRVYLYNCHRTGGDYSWMTNNLAEAPGSPEVKNIDARWALDAQWNPAAN